MLKALPIFKRMRTISIFFIRPSSVSHQFCIYLCWNFYVNCANFLRWLWLYFYDNSFQNQRKTYFDRRINVSKLIFLFFRILLRIFCSPSFAPLKILLSSDSSHARLYWIIYHLFEKIKLPTAGYQRLKRKKNQVVSLHRLHSLRSNFWRFKQITIWS